MLLLCMLCIWMLEGDPLQSINISRSGKTESRSQPLRSGNRTSQDVQSILVMTSSPSPVNVTQGLHALEMWGSWLIKSK